MQGTVLVPFSGVFRRGIQITDKQSSADLLPDLTCFRTPVITMILSCEIIMVMDALFSSNRPYRQKVTAVCINTSLLFQLSRITNIMVIFSQSCNENSQISALSYMSYRICIFLVQFTMTRHNCQNHIPLHISGKHFVCEETDN